VTNFAVPTLTISVVDTTTTNPEKFVYCSRPSRRSSPVQQPAQQPACARQETDDMTYRTDGSERPLHNRLHAIQSETTRHTSSESFCRGLALLLLQPVPRRTVSPPRRRPNLSRVLRMPCHRGSIHQLLPAQRRFFCRAEVFGEVKFAPRGARLAEVYGQGRRCWHPQSPPSS